ncbi:sugar porter family MFS transporter [Planctomycetota bacterium]|nr:sugar porter family MFS transporter [Planctomycetota bacterium]
MNDQYPDQHPTPHLVHAESLLYVYTLASVAAIGGFLFGYDSGVINGAVTAIQQAFTSSTVGTGFNVASILLGCAAGAIIAGPTADKIGRKPCMLITAVLFLISAIGSGAVSSSFGFATYRLIGGLAVGAASVLSPTYISEIAPAHLRGRLASLQQLAIVTGLFCAYLANYLIAHIAGSSTMPLAFNIPAWRFMFWMEGIPAIVFLIGSLIIPESPRYLVRRKHYEKARKIFHKMIGEHSRKLLEDVKQSVLNSPKLIFGDLFIPKTPILLPIIWLGIGLSIFQQFIGINVVFYYGEVLWEAAGFSESQALITNVITGIVNISATIVAILVIDKIGRKPMLVIGSIGMAISLTTMAITFAFAAVSPDGKLSLTRTEGITALTAAMIYVAFFCFSWGPVVWTLLGEIFNNRIRGAAIGIAAFAQWIANFLVTLTFPLLLSTIKLSGSYLIYAFFAILSLIFTLIFVRETKGKHLEEM